MKLKSFLATLTAAVMLMSSCGDDDEKDAPIGMVTDWAPIIINFSVENLDGSVNYVNDNFNDIIHTTTLTYKDKTYSVEENKLSKTYMPFFDGLIIVSTDTQEKYFRFGELDGSEDFDDDFVINFADGSSDVIHFKRVHKGGLNVDDSWTLNGKASSDRIFCLKHEFADGKSN